MIELRDVKLTVDNPNKDYVVGGSSNDLVCFYEDFFTDGDFSLNGTDTIFIPYSTFVSVENASYVATIKRYSDEENCSYEIVAADPAKVVEENGLSKIFNPSHYVGERSATHSASIQSSKKKDKAQGVQLAKKKA